MDIITVKELKTILGSSRVKEDCPMDSYTSFKVGGKADLVIFPDEEISLGGALKFLKSEKIPFFIMGNGSNLIVRDGGFRGVIVLIGRGFHDTEGERTAEELIAAGECLVYANAGELLSYVSAKVTKDSLAGLEFASGIPGSIGGAVYMNAGAYGGEMKDIVFSVRAYDIVNDNYITVNNNEAMFGYRKSIFSEGDFAILSVVLSLTADNQENISGRINELTAKRVSKQPLSLPSAGSFFKRPTGDYAGRLIEKSGLKGLKYGGAMVSQKHAGFIVNTGNATASDVINLMEIVRNVIFEKEGVFLEPEPLIIGENEN